MKFTENAKILLVEDNVVNQRVAALIMKRLNLRCDIASDGQKAIEMYKERLYDLIFMDIEMPLMDGLQSSKLIREFEKNEGLKNRASIIALTASKPDDLAGKYLEAGMDGFIEKPIRADLLADFLENFRKDTRAKKEIAG